MPRIGMAAQVIGDAVPLTVVRIDGPRLVAADAAGTEQAFVLHRLTGHWVCEGDPYWGRRLRLGDDAGG
jgi:hypothetical protein